MHKEVDKGLGCQEHPQTRFLWGAGPADQAGCCIVLLQHSQLDEPALNIHAEIARPGILPPRLWQHEPDNTPQKLMAMSAGRAGV